jgi:hypothetical protein
MGVKWKNLGIACAIVVIVFIIAEMITWIPQ